MRNSKSEILNSKQYQNSNVINSKLARSFEHLNLGLGILSLRLISLRLSLGFRASDLGFLRRG
ncbi:MAG: hypothetical protein HY769_03320 [Candidatus Stahlbacteria bacterium]|nr:hypothetical protein [Candidatus Stahlbacteria bacterium]